MGLTTPDGQHFLYRHWEAPGANWHLHPVEKGEAWKIDVKS